MQSKYMKRSSGKILYGLQKRVFVGSEFLPQFLAKTEIVPGQNQSRNRQFLAETRPEQLPRKQFFLG